jgi:hypothetical protein
MSLKRGELTPLGILGMRQLTFIPDHFSKITVKNLDIKILNQWINYNLNSRYAIKKTYVLDNGTNHTVEALEIGMEDPSEIAMLILGCPQLHKI